MSDDIIDIIFDIISVMLDEKNSIWIKIYKVLVVLAAISIVVIGIILGRNEATYTYYFGSKTGFDFLTFVMYFGISLVLAFAEWVSGMLFVNFLNNVQLIREKLEENKD